MVLGSADRVKSVLFDVSVSGTSELRQASRELQDIGETLGGVGAAGEGAESSLGDLNRELRETAGSAGTAGGGLASLQGQLATTDALAETLDDDIDDLGDALDGLDSDEVRDMSREMARVVSAADGLDESLDIETDDFDVLQSELADIPDDILGDFVQEMADADDVEDALDSFDRETRNIGPRFREVSEAVEDIEDSALPEDLDIVRGTVGLDPEAELRDEAGRTPLGEALEDVDVGDIELTGRRDLPELFEGDAVDVDVGEGLRGLLSGAGFETLEDVLDPRMFEELVDVFDQIGLSGMEAVDASAQLVRVLEDVGDVGVGPPGLAGAGSDIVDDIMEEGGLADAFRLQGDERGAQLVGEVKRVDDAFRALDDSVTDAVSGGEAGAFARIIERALTSLDDVDDLTPGRVGHEVRQELLGVVPDGSRQAGQVRRRLSARGTRTQVDVAEDFVRDLFKKDISDDVLEELIEGGLPDRESGVGTTGLDRADMLSRLGVGAVDLSDVDRDALEMDVETGLADLLDLADEFPEFGQALRRADSLDDALGVMSGDAFAAVDELVETFDSEVIEAAFSPEVLDGLVQASDNYVDSVGGLADSIEGAEDRLMSVETSFLADILADVRPEMAEGGLDGSEGDLVTRELLQAGTLRRAAGAETDDEREVLFRLFQRLGEAEIDVPSLAELDEFATGEMGLETDLEERLGDLGADDRDARRAASALAEQFQIEFELSDIETVGEFAETRNLGDLVGRGLPRDAGVEESDAIRELNQAVRETSTAQLRGDDPRLAGLLERALGETTLAGTIEGADEFEDIADEIGELDSIEGPIGQLFGEEVLADRAEGLGLSPTRFNRTASTLRRVRQNLSVLNPAFESLSLSLGNVNVAISSVAKQGAALVAVIGPLVTVLGGLVAGLGAATVAMGGFLALGAVGTLEAIEESMAGVTDRGEAMQEMMDALKEGVRDAVQPLAGARVGGLSAFQSFNTLIESALGALNDLSKTLRNFVETDEFEQFIDILGSGPDLGPGGALDDALQTLAESGALESFAEIVVAFADAVPGFIEFASEVTQALEGPGDTGLFTALSGLVDIMAILIRLGAQFLAGLSAIIGVAVKVSDILTDIIPEPMMNALLWMAENLAYVTGLYLGLAGALSAVATAGAALTATNLALVGGFVAIMGVLVALKVVVQNLDTIWQALIETLVDVREFLGDIRVFVMDIVSGLHETIMLARKLASMFSFLPGVDAPSAQSPDGTDEPRGGLPSSVSLSVDGGPLRGVLAGLSAPALDTGGVVETSGLARVHSGERVVPAAQVGDRGAVEVTDDTKSGADRGRRRAPRLERVVINNSGIIGMSDIERRIERILERKERSDSRRSGSTFIG